MSEELSRAEGIPLYRQLRRILAADIEEGRYGPGDQLPSEYDLVEAYGVSRHVARQAYQGLITEGKVVSRQGAGYFVNQPRIHRRLPVLASYTATMEELGGRAETVVIRQEIQRAPDFLRDRLGGDGHSQVLVLERLGLLNEEPVTILRGFYPLDLARPLLDQNLTNRSVYELLDREMGIRPHRAETVVSVEFTGPHESRLLEIPEGSPVLSLSSWSWSDEDVLFEYSETLYRSDRFEFLTEQTRAE